MDGTGWRRAHDEAFGRPSKRPSIRRNPTLQGDDPPTARAESEGPFLAPLAGHAHRPHRREARRREWGQYSRGSAPTQHTGPRRSCPPHVPPTHGRPNAPERTSPLRNDFGRSRRTRAPRRNSLRILQHSVGGKRTRPGAFKSEITTRMEDLRRAGGGVGKVWDTEASAEAPRHTPAGRPCVKMLALRPRSCQTSKLVPYKGLPMPPISPNDRKALRGAVSAPPARNSRESGSELAQGETRADRSTSDEGHSIRLSGRRLGSPVGKRGL